MTTNDTNAKGTTMDAKTCQMIREWVAKDGGDTEKTARWMARSLNIAGVRTCRQWVAEAMAAA